MAAVTLLDIAHACGVSKQTVSVILRSKGLERYRPETIDLVVKTAERLGYRANAAARAIAHGRLGAIGFLISDQPVHGFPSQSLLAGIERGCAAAQMDLQIARMASGGSPRMLRERTCDGLLLLHTTRPDPPLGRLLTDCGLPVIWINRDIDADAVRPDDRAAGHAAARALIDLGHRRIGWVGLRGMAEGTHSSVAERRVGVASALRAADLPHVPFPAPASPHVDAVLASARLWLRRPDRPTGVVTFGPDEALAVLYAAALEGIPVPEGLSLVTFSSDLVYQAGVNISTFVAPDHAMGEAAVAALVQRIRGGAAAASQDLAFALHPEGRTLAIPQGG